MAKIKFILDTRERKSGKNVVMLYFLHKGFRKQATLGLKVDPANWDEENIQVSTKEKNYRQINQRLHFFRSAAEGVLFRHYYIASSTLIS